MAKAISATGYTLPDTACTCNGSPPGVLPSGGRGAGPLAAFDFLPPFLLPFFPAFFFGMVPLCLEGYVYD